MRFLALVVGLVLAACGGHRDEVIEPGTPPLPPASGSVIGYLLDAQHDLALTDDQTTKLEKLDGSLAARNGSIDAQLRQIEKPAPAEELTPQQMKAGLTPERYNNAPGASTVGTDDSAKLHKMRDENDREAINEAMSLLDADQQTKAKRILEERGVRLPPEKRPKTAPATGSDTAAPLPAPEP